MSHPTPVPACLPWCTDHHAGIDGSYCRTRIRASYGDLVLSYAPVEGILVRILGADGMVTLDMSEAEHLTRALALVTYTVAVADCPAVPQQPELVAAGRKGGAL